MVDGARVRFTDALRVREFRALWGAEILALTGEQLARVALSLVVFAQTSSAVLTALTYALTFLPSIIGGVLLSGLADRYPRRAVMIVTDVVRAALAAAMAIPAMPLWALWTCVALLSLSAGPFKAAQQSILPQVLSREVYPSGLALRQVTGQFVQVAGFAGGGVLLTVVDPHYGLLFNAITFVASAAFVFFGVRHRPAAGDSTDETAGAVGVSPAVKPALATMAVLYLLTGLIGIPVVPEGLAAPYAHGLGAAAIAVGVLMAADPIGSIFGAWLTTRVRMPASPPVAIALGCAAALPLLACALRPGLVISAVLWAVSGVFATACLIKMQEIIVDLVPDRRRGRVMGRIATSLYAWQGLAIVVGGTAADVFGSFTAVAAAGAASVVLSVVAGSLWAATRSHGGNTQPAPSDEFSGQDEGGTDQMSLCTTASSDESDQELHNTDQMSLCSTENTSRKTATASIIEVGAVSESRSTSDSTFTVRRRRSRDWAIWGQPLRRIVYLVSVELVAIAVTVWLAVADPPTLFDLGRFAIIAVLGIVAAEASRRVERIRRRISGGAHVDMSSVWILSAALVTGPAPAAAVIVILHAHLALRSWSRTGNQPYRTMFNIATALLSADAAYGVAQLLADGAPWQSGSFVDLLVLASVAFTYWLVNTVLVAFAIALNTGGTTLQQQLGTWSENSIEAATLCVGALAAVLLMWHPWLVALVLIPLYVLHKSVLVRQLEYAATTDHKTGLLNAAAWQTMTSQEFERAQRDGSPIGLLMIDLDHFKKVNDAYGHLVGDQVLRQTAQAIQSEVRDYDSCGRFGGEEFVVTLPDCDHETCVQIGQRIRVRIAELTFTAPITELHVSASIGVATHPYDGADLEELLHAADAALFTAKNNGRDRVHAARG